MPTDPTIADLIADLGDRPYTPPTDTRDALITLARIVAAQAERLDVLEAVVAAASPAPARGSVAALVEALEDAAFDWGRTRRDTDRDTTKAARAQLLAGIGTVNDRRDARIRELESALVECANKLRGEDADPDGVEADRYVAIVTG